MRTARTAKFAAMSVAAVTIAGAVLVAGAGSAFADTFQCRGQANTPSRTCMAPVLHDGTRLFRPDGTLYTTLRAGTQVTVTCYYKDGNGNFQDHVTDEDIPNPITGHIADVSIDFGGHDPDEPPISLDHC
jgi:hypothetical protein